MTETQPKISETPDYWTHGVSAYPGPVAVVRMAQLIDYDDRLYEAARIVYRFLIAYYHKEYGDALLSMRHVSKVMRSRAPEGATVLSHSAVRRAIIALMETGWVVRTFKGRGKGKSASRYVPTLNVLDLASRGKFPELLHPIEAVEGGDELLHTNETVPEKLLHANETVGDELLHPNETKTPLLDPRTLEPQGSSKVNVDVSVPAPPLGLSAAAGMDGFEKIWRAYGKLGNKASSRETFAAIADPDIDHIAGRAASWAASAKPGRKRMPLEKWLAAEKYDEADRAVPDTEGKAKAAAAKPSPVPANDNAEPEEAEVPEFMKGSPSLWPAGEYVGQFIENDILQYAGEMAVKLKFKVQSSGPEHGRVLEHRFYIKGYSEDGVAEGNGYLRQICVALGVDGVDELDELMFLNCRVRADGTRLHYSSLAEVA